MRYIIHFKVGLLSRVYIRTIYADSVCDAVDQLCEEFNCTRNDIFIRHMEG